MRLVNETPYGLSGAVHTADVERGVAFAKQIVTGMFHVNGPRKHERAGDHDLFPGSLVRLPNSVCPVGTLRGSCAPP